MTESADVTNHSSSVAEAVVKAIWTLAGSCCRNGSHKRRPSTAASWLLRSCFSLKRSWLGRWSADLKEGRCCRHECWVVPVLCRSTAFSWLNRRTRDGLARRSCALSAPDEEPAETISRYFLCLDLIITKRICDPVVEIKRHYHSSKVANAPWQRPR